MRETILGNHIRKVPSVAVGCMRLPIMSSPKSLIFQAFL